MKYVKLQLELDKSFYDITSNNKIKQLRINSLEADVENARRPGVNIYKLQKSHFIDRGFARHFVMIEELTAEILAAEKKAYGKVIRMMAHEVNNTIGPVNSILASTLQATALWQQSNQLPY